LGNTPFARDVAYAELVAGGISAKQKLELSESALRGWALGEPDYVADLQRRTDRRLAKGRAGRPAVKSIGPLK
jgi:putative transposase